MAYDLAGDHIPYDPPWKHESLSFRLKALDSDLPRIVWLYSKPDTSTFRYRVYNMVDSMRCEFPQRASVTWFCMEEIATVISRIDDIDVIVLVRLGYEVELARLIAVAKARNIPVVFDCDDLVFDIGYIHEILHTLDQDTKIKGMIDNWFSYVGRIEAVARLCDGGIATNSFLAERMKKIINAPIHIIPNYLNRIQQKISDSLFEKKLVRKFVGHHPIGIGYFSGSPTHNNDLAIAAPALARLLKRDPNIRLRIVGFMDSLAALSEYSDRIDFLPLTDWMNLQGLIAEMEINIAPLQDNIFTNCKSELKYFEAAIVGTWTVATPTFTFLQAITNSEKGRLAKAEEWDEALNEAVDLARSVEKYAFLSQSNAEEVKKQYGWNCFCDETLEATVSLIN